MFSLCWHFLYKSLFLLIIFLNLVANFFGGALLFGAISWFFGKDGPYFHP